MIRYEKDKGGGSRPFKLARARSQAKISTRESRDAPGASSPREKRLRRRSEPADSRRGAAAQAGDAGSKEPSKDGPEKEAVDPELEAAQAEQTDYVSGEAATLAKKYHLEIYEVKDILRAFQDADKNNSGGLDKDEFIEVLRIVHDVKEGQKLPMKLVNTAWREMMRKSDLRADGLLEMNHMAFIEFHATYMFSQMVAEVKENDDETLTLKLSREHGISVTALDRIKQRFDQFDLDGSGFIEYDEFLHLLAYVLKAQSIDDLSESTASRFWQEIDIDGSGEVDFEEFTSWYVKYFNPADDDGLDPSKGPVHVFYDSFVPLKKRTK